MQNPNNLLQILDINITIQQHKLNHVTFTMHKLWLL